MEVSSEKKKVFILIASSGREMYIQFNNNNKKNSYQNVLKCPEKINYKNNNF